MNRAWAAKKIVLAVSAAAASIGTAQATDYQWTSGNFLPNVTAPSPLVPPDTLRIDAGAKTFNGIAWENQSTVNWNAGDIAFVSSIVTNSGLWDAKSDNSFVYGGGSASNFLNNGTFRKSAGAGVTRASTNNIVFINSGTIEAQTGVIEFAGGSNVFNNGTQFIGSGVTRISNNATFNDAFTSVNLVLAAGNYSGAGASGALLNGAVAWSGGTFQGNWHLAAGQIMNANTGGEKTFLGVNFANAGTLAWQTADAIRFVSSNFVNSGLIDLQADANLVYAGGGASNLTNTGTFRKSAGTSSSIGSNVHFINDGGVIDAQTGTIDFAGGSATFNAGTQFTGAGVNKVSANAVFDGAFTSSNLVLAGGNFHGGGTGAVLNGAVTWTGGQFANVWQIAPDQTLVAMTGADKTFNGVTFTNEGTLRWQTSDNLRFVSSNFINNNLVDLQDDANLVYAGGAASNFFNSAAGTFRKSAGTSSSIGGNIHFINDGGLIEAQVGTIDFAGGLATFNAGTRFAGAGVNKISNSATFNGEFHSTNLELAGGVFTGASAVLTGAVDWTGGAFGNAWQIASGHSLTALAGVDKTFLGVNFTNDGTMLWNTTDDMRFVSSTFTNNGVVDLQADANLVYAGGGASNFVNSGTFRKTSGGTSSIGGNIAFVNNAGVIHAQAGTIDFAGGGATFNAGTQFTGSGVNRISNDATFNGSFHSTNLVLANGTFHGGGPSAVLNGTVLWTGGSFSNTWQVAAGQTLIAKSGGNKTFSGVNFVNDGTVLWQTADNMRFVSSSVTNNGLIDLQDDASLVYAGGGASNFANTGTLRKSGGDGVSGVTNNINLTNPGTIDIRTGTFELPPNFANSGTIMGEGTVQTGLLTNSGHVEPGNSPGSPGSLSLTGNYVQTAAGTLRIEVENLGSVDMFEISGTASLAGTLAIDCFAACSFDVGDEFVILTAGGNVTGTFDGEPLLTGFASGDFETIYGLHDVRLRVTEAVVAVPEAHTWVLLLSGLAAVGWGARRRLH